MTDVDSRFGGAFGYIADSSSLLYYILSTGIARYLLRLLARKHPGWDSQAETPPPECSFAFSILFPVSLRPSLKLPVFL